MNIQHTSLRYSGLLAFFLSHIAFATCVVNSVPDASIQDVIDAAAPGDTITVSGTCTNTNLVFWKDDITLQGTGIISGDSKTVAPTVLISAKNVNIVGTAPRLRFTLGRNNTIRIDKGASARIVRVNVNSASGDNILVTGKSSAEFQYFNSTSARGTGGRGIMVEDGSYAHLDRVISSGNTGVGLHVDDSRANIIASHFTGNTGGGMRAVNSMVKVGNVKGNPGDVTITNNLGNTAVSIFNSSLSLANTGIYDNHEANTLLMAKESNIMLLGGNTLYLSNQPSGPYRTILLSDSSLIQPREGRNNIEDTMNVPGSPAGLDHGIDASNSTVSLSNINMVGVSFSLIRAGNGSRIFIGVFDQYSGTERVFMDGYINRENGYVYVGNVGASGHMPLCTGVVDYCTDFGAYREFLGD